jgi:dipeptidase D
VDEETGLTGAFAMKGDLLEGRILINLDTEEWGALYVGCAGGAESMITLPLEREDMPEGTTLVRIILSGMKGGHSGVDIHLQRTNAMKVMTRALWTAYHKMDLRLGCIQAGNKHNAIPRESRALVAVPAGDKDAFINAVKEQVAIIKEEYKSVDPGIEVAFEDAEPIKVFTKGTSDAVIRMLNGLPHGVVLYSNDIPDLVETSTNLAIVVCEEDKMEITMSNRSSSDTAVDGIKGVVRSIAELAGATVEEPPGYPGWKPNLGSRALKLSKEVYKEIYGEEPEVKAIHAGLECGIIGEKFPGMDMVSMGPQIEFPHSPDERVHIGSVEKFYDLLKKVLAAF